MKDTHLSDREFSNIHWGWKRDFECFDDEKAELQFVRYTICRPGKGAMAMETAFKSMMFSAELPRPLIAESVWAMRKSLREFVESES